MDLRPIVRALRGGAAGSGRGAAAANFAWLLADKGARFFLSVCVGIVVARHLGPGRFGELSYALALVGLVSVVVEGGLESIVKRELLRYPERAAGFLCAAAALRGAMAVVCYAGFGIAVWRGWLSGSDAGLLLVVGGLLFQPLLLVPDLWFQARLEAKKSVLIQLTALVAGAAARLALVFWDAPLVMFAWAAVGEMCLAGCLLALGVRRAGLSAAGRGLGTVAAALWRESWPLMLSGLSVGIYMRIDAVMLRFLAGEEAVGQYAAATRLSEIWYFVPTALASSVLPAMLRAREGGGEAYAGTLQRYFDLSAVCAYALAIPLSVLAVPLTRWLYGDSFAYAGDVLAVHAWATVFVFLGVARGQWLVNEGLSRFYLAATVAGALANVALNLVLIPRYAGVGAAWATVVSYAGAAWGASYFHGRVRGVARMQTNALLIPLRVWRYLLRR